MLNPFRIDLNSIPLIIVAYYFITREDSYLIALLVLVVDVSELVFDDLEAQSVIFLVFL
jgi:hypothetical protein